MRQHVPQQGDTCRRNGPRVSETQLGLLPPCRQTFEISIVSEFPGNENLHGGLYGPALLTQLTGGAYGAAAPIPYFRRR